MSLDILYHKLHINIVYKKSLELFSCKTYKDVARFRLDVIFLN